jgi:alpha-L-arabinofuranosidase
MEPVLGVWAGYAGGVRLTGDDLKPYVQSALDEIEYVTGDENTKWGHERAIDGHPAPFQLHYVEVGNEDNSDRGGGYELRFPDYFDAIRAKYPQLQIIATIPVKARTPDVVDEHFYYTYPRMLRTATHWDHYDRNGPKIFIGEWATKRGEPTPTFNSALSDAAMLTGLERNADLVIMACYAPMLVDVNPNGHQWSTSLIGFDAITSFGSPSYYVQKMFSQNLGDEYLPVQITLPASDAPAETAHGAVGVGAIHAIVEFKDVKVTSGNKTLFQSDFTKDLSNWTPTGSTWATDAGVLRETGNPADARCMVGDPAWTDYTFTATARKLSGEGGFTLLFRARDTMNLIRWSAGAANSSKSVVEQYLDNGRAPMTPPAAISIEQGKWYNLRVEVKGWDVRCFIDDRLIAQATESPATPPTLFASADLFDQTGQVSLKVVNVLDTPQRIRIRLDGAAAVSNTAHLETLAGNRDDVNTVQEPTKVAIKEETITSAAAEFVHELPARSVSVMRLDVR